MLPEMSVTRMKGGLGQNGAVEASECPVFRKQVMNLLFVSAGQKLRLMSHGSPKRQDTRIGCCRKQNMSTLS